LFVVSDDFDILENRNLDSGFSMTPGVGSFWRGLRIATSWKHDD